MTDMRAFRAAADDRELYWLLRNSGGLHLRMPDDLSGLGSEESPDDSA